MGVFHWCVISRHTLMKCVTQHSIQSKVMTHVLVFLMNEHHLVIVKIIVHCNCGWVLHECVIMVHLVFM